VRPFTLALVTLVVTDCVTVSDWLSSQQGDFSDRYFIAPSFTWMEVGYPFTELRTG
jgi:hypothetical protein